MKTLVLGLGNPILTDDGVGIRVAQALADKLDPQEAAVTETSMAGLHLLDLLVDFDRVVIIDAIQTKKGKPGQIHRLEPEALNITRHAATTHDIDFGTALELGRRLGLAMPQEIIIFGVEAEDVTTFNEVCTPEVERAIPLCAEIVREVVEGGTTTGCAGSARRGER